MSLCNKEQDSPLIIPRAPLLRPTRELNQNNMPPKLLLPPSLSNIFETTKITMKLGANLYIEANR